MAISSMEVLSLSARVMKAASCAFLFCLRSSARSEVSARNTPSSTGENSTLPSWFITHRKPPSEAVLFT